MLLRETANGHRSLRGMPSILERLSGRDSLLTLLCMNKSSLRFPFERVLLGLILDNVRKLLD